MYELFTVDGDRDKPLRVVTEFATLAIGHLLKADDVFFLKAEFIDLSVTIRSDRLENQFNATSVTVCSMVSPP